MKCNAIPYIGEEPYIFFSYCHADENVVFPLIERMVRDGYRVWYDEGIHPGSDWPEVIADRLARCSVCIGAISQAFSRSHNCKNELTFALENGKPLMTVLMEEFPLPLGMRLQLANTQNLKFAEYPGEELFARLYTGPTMDDCLGEKQDIEVQSVDSAVDAWRHRREVKEDHFRQGCVPKQLQMEAETEQHCRGAEQRYRETEQRSRETEQHCRETEQRPRETKQCPREAEQRPGETKQCPGETEQRYRETKQRYRETEQHCREAGQRPGEADEDRHYEGAEGQVTQDQGRAFACGGFSGECEDGYDACTVLESRTFCVEGTEEGRTLLESDAVAPLLVHFGSGELYEGVYPMTSVGRSGKKADIVLPQFKTVSSHHLDIIIYQGRNYIIDRGSANGTYVNGERLEKDCRVEVTGCAEVMLARERFLAAFDICAEFIRGERTLGMLYSRETKEKMYLSGDTVYLGRSCPWPGGALQSNKISRKHAELTYENGTFFLQDVSSNGTYVNHKRIPPREPFRLASGDNIRMGNEYFTFTQWRLKGEAYKG